MNLYYRLCWLPLSITIVFSFLLCQQALSEPVVEKTAAGDWVEHLAIPPANEIPVDELQDGQYYVLVDTQILVKEGSPTEHFKHYAIKIINASGLEESSQVSFSFDPAYQEAMLHSLQIRRQGQLLDRLPGAEVQLLRREKDMKALMYDGHYTANVIVDDVRVGDVIEYAYTISGENPVYQNHFARWVDTNWNVPVDSNHFRLIWPKTRRLYQKSHNTDLALEQDQQGDSIIYSLSQKKVPPVHRNSHTPRWFRRYGSIQLSDAANWSEVVEWAMPLYQQAYATNDEVAELIETSAPPGQTDAEKVMWALNYVQNNIRYLGIELGVNSHQPSQPGETLQRRYGDCKDKTVALIALLHQLGVTAEPVLVNSRLKHKTDNLLPTIRAFNHVIARVRVDEKTYWLDPTLKYQGHSLGKIYQPNFGVALVIAPGQRALTQMPTNDHLYGTHVQETFDLRPGFNEPVTYEVRTRFHGYNAEDNRHLLAEDGAKAIQEKYLRFYSQYYEGLASTAALEINDYSAQNERRIREQYRIDSFWERDEADDLWRGSIYASSLYTYLEKPEQRQRHEPLYLEHPVNIRQTTQVLLPESLTIHQSVFTEQNQYFKFTSKTSCNSNSKTLTLAYSYQSYTDTVTAEALAEYMSALERVHAEMDYHLNRPISETPSESGDGWWEWVVQNVEAILAIIVAVLLLPGGYCLFEWWRDSRKQGSQENGFYYAVSLGKFCVVFLGTLGLYPFYWFYRNWHAVKQRDQSDIMPFWRTFFHVFWYYPFYLDLKRDSQQRFGRSILPQVPWIITLLLLLVAAHLSDRFTDEGYEFLYLISVVCYLPFVRYILLINRHNHSLNKQHSRFRPRHILMAGFVAMLILVNTGCHLYWIPIDEVVRGKRLPDWDRAFMQRQGLLKEDAELLYFYSDALLLTRRDGNGVTDTNVFSYWYDQEQQTLLTRNIDYKGIDDIDVEFATSDSDTTVITVIPKNGTSFILYASSEKGKDRLFVEEIRKRLGR